MTYSVSNFAANYAADGFASATAYARDTAALLAAARTSLLRSKLNTYLGAAAPVTAIAVTQAAQAYSVLNVTVPYVAASGPSTPWLIRTQLDQVVRFFFFKSQAVFLFHSEQKWCSLARVPRLVPWLVFLLPLLLRGQ